MLGTLVRRVCCLLPLLLLACGSTVTPPPSDAADRVDSYVPWDTFVPPDTLVPPDTFVPPDVPGDGPCAAGHIPCGTFCVDPRTDPNHCGACSVACVAGSVCVDAVCQATCPGGQMRCGAVCTDVLRDHENCGMCGNACRAGEVCTVGLCASSCMMPQTYCMGMPSYCADLLADDANCGACGRRCPDGQSCAMGTCVGCGMGQTSCGGRCVNTRNDESNCGACGIVCPGEQVCLSGMCTVVCGMGQTNCAGVCTDTSTDLANCGACGRRCPMFANGTAACVASVCGGTCTTGFGNCNGNPMDGCEVNLATTAAHCGMCGHACMVANAMPSCAMGTCGIASCSAGWGDCDHMPGNGCEVGLTSNNRNCGTCGTACATGTICRMGTCGAPVVPNDLCAGATTLDLTTGSRITVMSTNVGATHDVDATCGGGGGADVFYRFTLTRRELVHADTLGATWDTMLFFASDCTTPLRTATTPGDILCNDDAGGAGCMMGGTQSFVVALLGPGTYYLVLTGYAASTGMTPIHLEHLPVGSGAVQQLPAGGGARTGTTTGTGVLTAPCATGATGPEITYWWRTCPESVSGPFSASTCAGASWNTVLYLLNGSGMGDACNDDAGGACGMQSLVASTIPAGAGIHAFFVDGMAGAAGAYTVTVTRP